MMNHLPWLKTVGFLVVILLALSCLVDNNERCEAGQILDRYGLCSCPPAEVLGDDGCIPCGENEIAIGSSCQCLDGFQRSPLSCACFAEALGTECNETEGCADPIYSYCFRPEGADSGYCTVSGCTTDEDCELTEGYICERTATTNYCKRPVDNVTVSCEPWKI
ncbi:MAG: hypothetical protein IPJ88_09210 [Myxococcales bacterium]|nr:MAG: hypothetical protein IPJ88_09210 [Myxococcales bacterium]